MNQQESMPESQSSSDSSSMQDQTTLMQEPNSEQNTQWQQDVGLLPGLGSINHEEINIEQKEQLMQNEQNHDSSTAGNTSRNAGRFYSRYNAREQGWRSEWPQKKT